MLSIFSLHIAEILSSAKGKERRRERNRKEMKEIETVKER